MRTFSTSVAVRGGELPLASVRVTAPIPLEKIREAVEAIHKVTLTAPVEAGDIVIKGLLGRECDVVTTRSVGVEAS